MNTNMDYEMDELVAMDNRSDVSIEPRKAWHAITVPLLPPVKSPVRYVFCMNTHTQPCQFQTQCLDIIRRLQHMHLNVHKLADIRYNFLIGDDGNIYEGRGWGVQPLLPNKYSSYNDKSIVIGFIGEYSEPDLPRVMGELRERLVDYGISCKYIHRNFQPIQIFEKIKGPYQHNMHNL